ncbi:FMN-binding glutamate synthase family protein [Colwellia sp. UCD-KL20]|uniref:FMN-binding glutamate synthase family protein n=1 Tax=Colwellia sp. UCD-KL20 TaxID=1917165 RepID=UPI0009713F11|nr:FMN-binding glutamate synthase family protein [Colwellia sp. UCD-KL20]
MLARQWFYIISVTSLAAIFFCQLYWPSVIWLFVVAIPLILLGLYDVFFSKHTILRIYPVVGHIRYLLESFRPEIQQYFIETNLSGRPINREFRDLVYQRSKGVNDTRPFGTQFDVYKVGYQWMSHSMRPIHIKEQDPRVTFGRGEKAYKASLLNISAMSFGALSKNAILALNKGAKKGGFYHNSGEGGISPYHLQYGADLVWQIGTGYFGCRDSKGNFCESLFTETAHQDYVKMIEIKLSQGAKPGHGGILPAVKLTPEIAAIRKVPLGQDVISPPAHSSFNTPIELLTFIDRLKELSGGKPVGIKLCIGNKREFLALCKAMVVTGSTPDFITIDGSEGGTGASPIEFTNSVGMPLRDALVFVQNALVGCGVRDKLRLIASGKALSAFHVLRLLALGADTVNSARAMMLSLGCIQSRHCNNDKCPTGIATQDAARYNALDYEEKGERAYKFHAAMIKNVVELVGAAGLENVSDIKPHHIQTRVSENIIEHLGQRYNYIAPDSLLDEKSIPPAWQYDWHLVSETTWK